MLLMMRSQVYKEIRCSRKSIFTPTKSSKCWALRLERVSLRAINRQIILSSCLKKWALCPLHQALSLVSQLSNRLSNLCRRGSKIRIPKVRWLILGPLRALNNTSILTLTRWLTRWLHSTSTTCPCSTRSATTPTSGTTTCTLRQAQSSSKPSPTTQSTSSIPKSALSSLRQRLWPVTLIDLHSACFPNRPTSWWSRLRLSSISEWRGTWTADTSWTSSRTLSSIHLSKTKASRSGDDITVNPFNFDLH